MKEESREMVGTSLIKCGGCSLVFLRQDNSAGPCPYCRHFGWEYPEPYLVERAQAALRRDAYPVRGNYGRE